MRTVHTLLGRRVVRLATANVVALLLVAGPAVGEQKPRHVSPSEARSQALLTHHRNQKRAKPNARKPGHEKRGNVAVVVDEGSIVTRARPENLMDLVGPVSIAFTPAGDGYAVALSDEGPDIYGSVWLDIYEPTDAAEVALGFPFPFFGHTYESVWVNGAGNLTFGAPDTDPFDPIALRDLPRFSAGPPRVAPVYADLFPSGVTVEALSDRVVITWDLLATGVNGVQAVLRADGSIRFVYPFQLQVTGVLGDSIVGVSPGEAGAPVQVVDYLSDLPATFGAGIIAEAFGSTVNLFDLSLQSLAFAPTADGFAVSRGPAQFDADLGPALDIAPGGQAVVPLPFPFPLRGRQHAQVVISDNGTIGFDSLCSPFGLAFVSAGPCIFVFGRNLQPDLGGSIHAASYGDRLVVTWSHVPSFGITVTAQAILHSDGRVVLSYPTPIIPVHNVIVGVAGGASGDAIQSVDFTADLPVAVSTGTVLEQFTPTFQHFDLFDRHLTFTPEGGGFRITRGRGGFDDAHHRLTDRILVGCESETPGCLSVEVPLPFVFPFLSRTYDRLFVNASGNVTLGAPDPVDVNAARMLGGPPRITPISFSGNPSVTQQLGHVSVFANAEGAVITWDRLTIDSPLFYMSDMTVQAILAVDGTIRLVYSNPPPYGLVGLAEGANEGPIQEIDLTADQPNPLAAGMIFEEFGPEIPFATVDTIELARELYTAQPDTFDFLVVFTDFPVDLGGAYAFNEPISNHTLGLGLGLLTYSGQETYDESSFFGSGGELESLLMMNNINIYWPDAHRLIDPPIEIRPGLSRRRIMGIGDGGPVTRTTHPWSLGYDSPMSLLAHEVGHRWLAHPRFVHPQTGVGPDSFDLVTTGTFDSTLGSGHWSPFTHTALPSGQFPGEPRASAMEGSGIRDFGGASFPPGSTRDDCRVGEHAFATGDHLRDGYSALDQYFMGLRASAEVGPFFYMDDAKFATGPRPAPRPAPPPPPPPYTGSAYCGTPVNLDVSHIIAHPAMGPRIPAFGDENDGGGVDVKTMAFVLLTTSANHEDAVKRVDTFRKAWERYANGFATGMRGRFDTSLNPRIH